MTTSEQIAQLEEAKKQLAGLSTKIPTLSQSQVDIASKSVSGISKTVSDIGETVKNLDTTSSPNPISTTEDLKNGQNVKTFIPPDTTANKIVDSYTQSMLGTLEKQRKSLEDTYKTQLSNITKQKEESQKKLDEYVDKQKTILESANPELSSTYAQEQSIRQNQLNYAETASKTLEKNYAENQALVDEMDGLLTQINNDLISEKNITGLDSIRTPRIAQATEQATARVGVIESVMAARNNQISVANTAIDRAQNAMTAARNDKLNYYNSLLNFYNGLSSDEKSEISSLTSNEKSIVNSQIKLLEEDLSNTQKNADYIKSLMIDPDTANIVALSGVTLNDTPEQVQKKFAQYSYNKEIIDTSNKMQESGFRYLTDDEASKTNSSSVRTTTDSRGVVKHWLIPTTLKTPETKVVGGKLYQYNPSTGAWDIVSGTTGGNTVVNLYGDELKKLIDGGMTPEEAVRGLIENEPDIEFESEDLDALLEEAKKYQNELSVEAETSAKQEEIANKLKNKEGAYYKGSALSTIPATKEISVDNSFFEGLFR